MAFSVWGQIILLPARSRTTAKLAIPPQFHVITLTPQIIQPFRRQEQPSWVEFAPKRNGQSLVVRKGLQMLQIQEQNNNCAFSHSLF